MISVKSALSSALAGYRFPREVIAVASPAGSCATACPTATSLLAARGVEVDHVTMYRWV
jgi:transposase-like protein